MFPSASITHWIDQLKAGDPDAAQKLWESYFARLVELARAKLHGTPRRVADEEDVALSAFDSFCRGAERGRFPDLRDRDNLWRLLVTLTARKALHLARDARRLKRGGGAVLDEAALAATCRLSDTAAGLEQLLAHEPSPEFAVEVAEECSRLLDRLGSPELRQVALWKMEGFTSEEIAVKLGRAVSTVERKLRVIRTLWAGEGKT